MNLSAERPITMFGPDFTFDFEGWTAHPVGVGAIPADRHGARIAVVGAGISGVIAAFELMRMGVHPIVYERPVRWAVALAALRGLGRCDRRARRHALPGFLHRLLPLRRQART